MYNISATKTPTPSDLVLLTGRGCTENYFVIAITSSRLLISIPVCFGMTGINHIECRVTGVELLRHWRKRLCSMCATVRVWKVCWLLFEYGIVIKMTWFKRICNSFLLWIMHEHVLQLRNRLFFLGGGLTVLIYANVQMIRVYECQVKWCMFAALACVRSRSNSAGANRWSSVLWITFCRTGGAL